MDPSVHSSVVYNSQDMETACVHQQMNGQRLYDTDIQIYNGMLFIHKKERNNAICSNMDEPRDYHIKRSKSDRERQIPHDITYV